MHTLAWPKSVFSFELGPMRHLALSELAYLIKDNKKKATVPRHDTHHKLHPRTTRSNQKQNTFLSIARHVPSEIYQSVGSGAGNVLFKIASNFSQIHGICEAGLTKLVGQTLSTSGATILTIARNQPGHISRALLLKQYG